MPYQRDGQVGIVGHDGLAVAGQLAGDDPAVAADVLAAELEVGFELLLELGHLHQLLRLRLFGRRHGERRLGRIAVEERVEFVGAEVLAGHEAVDLLAEVAAQSESEHVVPAEGVVDRPRLRLEAQDQELRRELVPLREIGVDTGGVRRQRSLAGRAQRLPRRSGGIAEAERAQPDVLLDALLAEDLGEAPVDDAALQLELPKAVLRVHVAGGEERVVVRLGVDERDAVRVAADLHGRGNSRHGKGAAILRKTCAEAAPGVDGERRTGQKHQRDEARHQWP
jgi:hypothetical protein